MNETDRSLVRISLIEPQGGLSVAAPYTLVGALVAALATFPQSVEAHLRATDAIFWGASHLVVSALIAHDRQELLWRQGYRAPPSLDPARDTWALTDEHALQRARLPAAQGLLWVDFASCEVRHYLPSPGIATHGEVPIFDGKQTLARTVTYDLRGSWDIIAIDPRFMQR
jgi:hypothetical protein